MAALSLICLFFFISKQHTLQGKVQKEKILGTAAQQNLSLGLQQQDRLEFPPQLAASTSKTQENHLIDYHEST